MIKKTLKCSVLLLNLIVGALGVSSEGLAQPVSMKPPHIQTKFNSIDKGTTLGQLLKAIKEEVGYPPRLQYRSHAEMKGNNASGSTYVVPSVLSNEQAQRLFAAVGLNSKAIDVFPEKEIESYCRKNHYNRFLVPYDRSFNINPFSFDFVGRDFSEIDGYHIEWVHTSKTRIPTLFVVLPDQRVRVFEVKNPEAFNHILTERFMFVQFRHAFLSREIAKLSRTLDQLTPAEFDQLAAVTEEMPHRGSWQMLELDRSEKMFRWAVQHLKQPIAFGVKAKCPVASSLTKNPMKLTFRDREIRQEIVLTLCNDTHVLVEDVTNKKSHRKSLYKVQASESQQLKSLSFKNHPDYDGPK